MKSLYLFARSMRPEQWTKNLVAFAALIFSRNMMNPTLAWRSVEAFLVFSLLSGMIYVINDITDVESDRRHPRKQHRPLASGKLNPVFAGWGAALGILVAVYLSWSLGRPFLLVAVGFLLLNLLYTYYLKRVVLLDAVSISVSFVLRAIGGVEVLSVVDPAVELSPWLLICTLFLSLFLAFCKRRHELLTLDDAAAHRASLAEYSPQLLDQLVAITAGGSVIAYAIYTIWPDTVDKFGTSNLVYTVPLVLIGVMRYLYLVYNKEKGGSPSDLLLNERFLLIDVVTWVLLVVAILWDF